MASKPTFPTQLYVYLDSEKYPIADPDLVNLGAEQGQAVAIYKLVSVSKLDIRHTLT